MAAVTEDRKAPGAGPGRIAVVAVLALATAGVALRLAYQRSTAADPLQGAALLDTAAYQDDAGAMLASGPLEPPVSFRPPGYPWLLAAVHRVAGGFAPVVRVQAFLDGLSVLLLGWIAWRLTASALLAACAALLLAANPLLIYFSGERLETSWMVFWVVAHLGLGLRAVERGGARNWAAAGASLAAAALVRPNALLWAPFLAAGAWRRHGAGAAVAAVAALVLVVAPVTVKNRVLGGQWVLVSANGGVNLWLGNVPDPEIQGRVPYYAHLPGPVAGWLWNRLEARARDAGALTLAAQSRYFTREALAAMAADPLRTAALFGLKTAALLNRVDLSNNRDLYRAGSPLRPFAAWFLSWNLLLPLAAAGLWRLFRRPDPRWRWVAAFAGVLALSVLLFFVSGRHRAPLLPPVILLAVAALAEFGRSWRTRDFDPRPFVLLLIASFVVAHDWFGHRRLYAGYEIDPVGVGNAWLALGRPAEAEAAWKRALDRIPEDALARGNLASLRIDQGRPREAEALLREALAAEPGDARLLNRLGLALLLQDRAQEALAPLQEAVRRKPDYGLAWMNQGRVLAALHRNQEARAALERALLLLGRDPAAGPLREFLAGLPEDG